MFNVSNIGKSTTTLATGALNNLSKVASTAMNSALGTVNSAANQAMSAATSTVAAINSAIPSANSLLPFNNTASNATKNNSAKNNGATNTGTNTNKNSFNSGFNNFKNVFNNSNNKGANTGLTSYGIIFGIILFLIATFLVAMFVFQDEFNTAWDYLVKSIRKLFTKDTPMNETPDEKAEQAEKDVTTPMPTPLDTAAGVNPKTAGILNTLLPMGTKEVFNVSTNDYTFYDSEPLCLALGAELATYEQVKEAWNKGGDWCNYGWTKGQLAIYPTQKETWDKLQNGPADEKSACGRPGVNGGYFDNPEMRFGVNCYGVKPDQSSNDERLLMENGTIPKTASTLKMNQQIQDIKNNLDTIGILPFSGNKWSA